MIHIATVHWQSDKWIDLQLQYLEQYLSGPYRVYAFLNDIPQQHYSKFHYVCDEPIEEHAIKLNLLADVIAAQAKDDDLLLFIDGDAFPIAPLTTFLSESLQQYPLAAIQRREHMRDIQPHPSFCATTVGFWKKIKGDWKKGYCWKDSSGQLITDTGGNLLKILNEQAIDWLPLHRSHSIGEDALCFGIYHDLIYHHGAGFRTPFSLIDMQEGPFWLKLLWLAASKSRSLEAVIYRRWEKAMASAMDKDRLSTHDALHAALSRDPQFFQNLPAESKQKPH